MLARDVRRQRILIRGEPFSYLEAGPDEGPLVVCLHGFPDIPATWEPVAAELAARGHRVVAPFLRGYAPSTLSGPFCIDGIGADVVGLVDDLSPGRPASLVGHDWGALATHAAASRAPERFRRIATLSVPHPRAVLRALGRSAALQLRRSWYIAFFQAPILPELLLPRDHWRMVERLWHAWSPGWKPPRPHLAAVKQCLAASMPAPLQYYRALPRWLATGSVGPVEVPCLYLHGADDGCVGAEMAAGQERWLRGGLETEVLPGCGHFLQLERPEAVAQRLVHWLA